MLENKKRIDRKADEIQKKKQFVRIANTAMLVTRHHHRRRRQRRFRLCPRLLLLPRHSADC